MGSVPRDPNVPPTGLPSKPKLLQELQSKLRLGHYSPRTVQSYAWWVRRFVRFHGLRHPRDLGEAEVSAFLNDLAERRRVAPSTQAQALSALLFLYREVLGRPLGDLGRLVRARPPTRLPRVLTRDEVARPGGEDYRDSPIPRNIMHPSHRSVVCSLLSGPPLPRCCAS